MTLRKSIFISMAVHLLLFGTGLLVAGYAGGPAGGNREPIMVTLSGWVGSASDAKPSVRPRQRRSSVEAPIDRMLPLPEQMETASPMPDTPLAASGDAHESSSGSADADQAAGHSEIGQATGAASALVSSEQWAVIVSSIERVKSYPRFARERGIEGVVRVRFRLRPRGDVDRVEVVKSSGSDILDESSIQTVYRASPLPYVSGWVEVPIAYLLQ